MILRYTLLWVVLVLAISFTSHDCLGATSIQAKAKLSNVVSQETYNRVLDILFPREDTESGGTFFVLILRFKPSFHPESQVVIRRRFAKVEVLEYTSLDGNIYSKLNQLLATSESQDPGQLAKLIKVKKRIVQESESQVKLWHTAFLNSVSGALATFRKRNEEYEKASTLTVALDGTFYDLWYQQGVDEISFSVYDQEVSDQQPNGEIKLTEWMNAVRLDIARHQ